MWKRTIVAASVAALSMTAVAAQENATFTLRSGERLTGQLLDMGGAGFTIRVDGQERQIPTGDLALIDFANSSMSQADWEQVNSGVHIIWLRNGETLRGQLWDVGGTSPLRLSVKVGGTDRDFTSSEVSRIALGRPTTIETGTGGAGGGQGITVSSRSQWTPTGITVRRGDTLTINANGEIRISGDPNDRATAHGVVAQRFDPRAPLPRTLAGALIGRIGSGQPFGVGASATIQAPGNGQLFLGVNDSNVSDNDGAFQVTVQHGRARR